MKVINDNLEEFEMKDFNLPKGEYLALGDRMENLREVVIIESTLSDEEIRKMNITLIKRDVRVKL